MSQDLVDPQGSTVQQQHDWSLAQLDIEAVPAAFVRPDPSSITTLSLMLDCERRVRAALASMPCENQIAVASACEETFGFHPPEQCKELLPPSIAPRIDAALEARAKGTTIYLLDGNPPASA